MFARLDQASARTGMPINSIVIAACLEWMARHVERTAPVLEMSASIPPPPRWATLRRAVIQAVARPGSSASYPFERFTAAGQKLLTMAHAESQVAGHAYIGTEHLLLAAFQDTDFASARVLAGLGIDEGEARRLIARILGQGRSRSKKRIVPTARVKRVVEIAFELCSSAGHTRVGTGHLLLALSVEGDGLAARVLNDLGATRERIEGGLQELSGTES
jgi:hypothetical protein